MSEFDFEPIPGLPAELPAGERLLWQGTPQWRAIAQRVFHIRAVTAYFGVMVLWRIGWGWAADQSFHAVAISTLWLSALAIATVGFLALVARLIAGTTVYSITNRRVVMRFGLAFPISLNVPFRIVEAAWAHETPGHGGDIALQLNGDGHIAYLHLWPHARPWQLNRPQPMLRCIGEALEVSEILAGALAAAGARASQAASAAVASVRSRSPESAAA
jgi:hypothetical protein